MGSGRKRIILPVMRKHHRTKYLVVDPEELFLSLSLAWVKKQMTDSEVRIRLLLGEHLWLDLLSYTSDPHYRNTLGVVYHYTEKIPDQERAVNTWALVHQGYYMTFHGWGKELPDPLGVVEAEPLLLLAEGEDHVKDLGVSRKDLIPCRGAEWKLTVIREPVYNPNPRILPVLRKISKTGEKPPEELSTLRWRKR